jgi:hypothetical protein
MVGSVDSNWEWREYGRIGRLEADIPQLGKLYGGVQQSRNPTWAQVSTAPIWWAFEHCPHPDIPQFGKLYGGVQQSRNPTWCQGFYCTDWWALSIAHIILSNSCP